MSDIGNAVFQLDADHVDLVLEAATLLSTLAVGTGRDALCNHARHIDGALAGIEPAEARTLLAATSRALKHAALYAAARPDLESAVVAAMDARMTALARSHIAVVVAMGGAPA